MSRFVGERLRRREDGRLLTGRATFVADLRLPGMLEVALLRSPVAHAWIEAIETGTAASAPGVVAVVTGADLEGRVRPFTRFVDQEETPPGLEAAVHPRVLPCPIEVLPRERVRYVGQALAAVVAGSRALAEDALEQLELRLRELPAVVDPEAALGPAAPQVHEAIPGNLQAHFTVEVGEPDRAFQEAAGRVSLRVVVPRTGGNPLETRGVVAAWDGGREELTVWSSTQVPFAVRTRISEMLGLAEERVRVIAPEVGGGFGPKVNVYPEEVLVAHLARHLGRPVRWIEDRREHLVATGQGRGQVHLIEAAYDSEGRVLAVRDRFLVDCGAYNPFSLTCAYNTAAHLRGLYRIPNLWVRGECVLTNKVPNVPYRGAGRPEAVFAMERVLEVIAARVGRDPAEVRMRNLIGPASLPHPTGMPYRDGAAIVLDGGDYPGALRRALELAGYEEVRRRQPGWRRRGRRVGVGMACYVEGTGIGPFEGCRARIDASGEVVLAVGSTPHGQGHETILAQVCADHLGVSPERVRVRAGDTALLPYGVGSFASRSAVVAGTAVAVAAGRLRERVLEVASRVLEVAPQDLVIEDGVVHPAGAPARRVTLAELARAAMPGPRSLLAGGEEPGLEAQHYFRPETVTFAYGAHVAVVEVDPELGTVRVLRYAVVHDCGRPINPTLVEGQVVGGVAQGLGAALLEECVYGEGAQPLTTTYLDYLLPTAVEVPSILQEHLVTPSERNPLGVRGVGEGGAICPPAAIANAVADALGRQPDELSTLPLSPERVWRTLADA
ncbi:MAG TPA: xanthine dehydrogenase family protein molybdopterin-binding subunit [Candidatus Dormibacteraeota bacterium]|nr:xanthine dehydrogenase family protein molybdopterin-binding subunit [Candidatus Dormibacteraeota bacterium]